MGTIYKVPNRIVYWWSWVVGILFLVWFFTNNMYVAVPTGILGLIFSITAIVKPQIMPRMKLYFSEQVPDRFFNWSQRVFGLILAVIFIFILFNYRISKSSDIGVACLLFFGGILIIDILWVFYCWKGQTRAAKSYVIFSLIVCPMACAMGIALILANSAFTISETKTSPLPIVIGIAIGFGIVALWSWWDKKQKSNLRNSR